MDIRAAEGMDGGIEKYVDRIFQVFQRLHTREKYGGTGVGLAVVKIVVERHGRKVWIESTPGEGSTFFLTLTAARIGEVSGVRLRRIENPIVHLKEKGI